MKDDQWISNMKNLFEMIDCTEVEKRKLATFLLQDEVRVWWEYVKRANDVTLMDQDGFEMLFYGKYVPHIVRE